MNILTISGIVFILGSVVGLLIISAKYGIKQTLDIYTGRERKKVIARISAQKGLIGSEQTQALVEKYQGLPEMLGTSNLGSLGSRGSTTQDLFRSSEKVDALLDQLMGNNSSTTMSLEIDTKSNLNYEDELPEEQTGLLIPVDSETEEELEQQAIVEQEIHSSLAQVQRKGIFTVSTIYDNIEI